MLVLVATADAHDGLGRAQPRVEQSFVGAGSKRSLQLRITDVDSGKPIPNATVAVTARKDGKGEAIELHARRTSAVLYVVPFALPSAGTWAISVAIAGQNIVPAGFSINVPVSADELSSPGSDDDTSVIGLVGGLLAALAVAWGSVALYRRRRPA